MTRKQPFEGLNFMGVALAVLEGQRPRLPVDCPVKKLMKKCWHGSVEKRPTMEAILQFLVLLTGDQGNADHV